MAVDGKLFHRIFQGNADGEKILEELSRLFYDRNGVTSYTRGDPHHTTFLEGQRSVIGFIINKIGMAGNDEETITLDKE